MAVDWHQRYLQQSYWTKSLRDYLTSNLPITPNTQALEIGCGTGVITHDFITSHQCSAFGIDNKLLPVQVATRNYPDISFSVSDSGALPFSTNSFDIVFCHYFLLWVDTIVNTLHEALRILKPGGNFLVFAEPDHAARIDSPDSLIPLGALQTQALRNQGANVQMGRNLPSLLTLAGFSDIQYGILGYDQGTSGVPAWWGSEWEVLEDDINLLLPRAELENFRQLDRAAWISGSRVLWIPTFYARCKKSENVI